MDGNGDLSVLAHYCRLLRLVSGMPGSAVLSLADGFQALRADDQKAVQLRATPQVQEFWGFLGSLTRVVLWC